MSEVGASFTVNLHLSQACDMGCVCCFANYPRRRPLGKRGWLRCIESLAEETAGIPGRKVNFAGGEPTLLPFLGDLVEAAKARGFLTGIVTNGRSLGTRFLRGLAGTLDIVGLSVDSTLASTNLRLGRSVGGEAWDGERYLSLARSIKAQGYYLKINTVASALNANEDFSPFIAAAEPDRWKVMQCLFVEGQSREVARPLAIDDAAFDRFLRRHSRFSSMVPESSSQMRGTYIMVDPSGRPYGNASGKARYGLPISKAGLLGQLEGLGYSEERARERGAFYRVDRGPALGRALIEK